MAMYEIRLFQLVLQTSKKLDLENDVIVYTMHLWRLYNVFTDYEIVSKLLKMGRNQVIKLSDMHRSISWDVMVNRQLRECIGNQCPKLRIFQMHTSGA